MNENRSQSRSNGDTQRSAPRLGPEHETAGRYRDTPGYRSTESGKSGYARSEGYAHGEHESHAGAGTSPGSFEQYRGSYEEAEGRRHEETWRGDSPSLDETGAARRSGLPVTTLLRSLAGDAATLTRKEMALARNEISEAISSLKVGIISSATGGGVLFAGLLFLLLAATLGLATVMAGWLAALIVGGVVFLFGLILVGTGKKKMEADNFRPDRTIDAMRKDQEMMHRRTPQ
jgi:hypothetical protein